jgi:hypothetical protein
LNDIHRARELIAQPYGWVKKTGVAVKHTKSRGDVVAYCMLGAIADVTGHDICGPRVAKYAKFLATVIEEQYPEFKLPPFVIMATASTMVAQFNDADTTKKADVLKVMDKAAVLYDEKGNL